MHFFLSKILLIIRQFQNYQLNFSNIHFFLPELWITLIKMQVRDTQLTFSHLSFENKCQKASVKRVEPCVALLTPQIGRGSFSHGRTDGGSFSARRRGSPLAAQGGCARFWGRWSRFELRRCRRSKNFLHSVRVPRFI